MVGQFTLLYQPLIVIGFPYPENTALASHLESLVRINGGLPATVGVLNGVARVGFGAEELIELTSSAGKAETRKVSRRDLGYLTGMVCFPALLLDRMLRFLISKTGPSGKVIQRRHHCLRNDDFGAHCRY